MAETGAKILIVDDNPTNLKVLLQVLEAAHYSVLVATSGANALRIAGQALPDLILLDVMMPEMDGYEVCRRLKQQGVTQPIPVIFITALDQSAGVVAGFDAGGVDYIPKPFRREEVLARVQAHLSLRRLTRELEEKNAALEARNLELKATHQQLEEAQRRLIAELEEELQTAHELQMGLMPKEAPRIAGYEFAGRCFTANHVGGDIFKYYPLPQGQMLGVLADVTGHAMDAAVPLLIFCGILETQMELGGSIEELFSRLNRSLHRTLPRHTFVCLTMGALDPATRILRLANAGCPYPYHYRAATGQVVEVQLDAYPLGVRPDTLYRTVEIQLEPGDGVVFCSDGIIEATNTAGELFGFARTAAAIRSGCAAGLPAGRLLDQLIWETKSFSGEVPQGDDQTVVVLRVEK
ncbi:MAG: SpoIIE family protein phosphatase [Candidatus Latescibacteria bacterium]|nr:SpoIIE family protein phosphatase [Candidatus Latescibacterota bacterium]